MPTTCWIKNPQAIFTANQEDARGGVVIQNYRVSRARQAA